MIIRSIPCFQLQYDAGLRLLRISWAGGQDMRRLRNGLSMLTKLAESLQVLNCLVEMDSFPDFSAYDQIWLSTNCLSSASRLRLHQVVVTIHPERVYHQLTIESLLSVVRPYLNCDVQFFEQPAQALRWFAEGTDRQPALQAEWEAASILQPAPQDGAPPTYRAVA